MVVGSVVKVDWETGVALIEVCAAVPFVGIKEAAPSVGCVVKFAAVDST